MVTTKNKEKVINVLELKETDSEIKGNKIYALDLGSKYLAITFDQSIRIFQIEMKNDENLYKCLIRSDKIFDLGDLTILFSYLLSYDEIQIINKLRKKNKNVD